jgi:hypothetical protein
MKQVIRSKGLHTPTGRFQAKELAKTSEFFASFAKGLLIVIAGVATTGT